MFRNSPLFIDDSFAEIREVQEKYECYLLVARDDL